ncbi:LysR family transcriptional regulator [Lysinibacillus capsici]|uniref:LysR family transcriptional regulator n=1 Tax=Lysinibacillus capsici TaxID=2115968 RepID=UPI003D73C68C
MNINDLTIFRTVVQTGSFSKAATALNYTQSNISMKIQSLEALYETTFFYRGHRGIRLTPKGEQFYELVLKMLHLYEKPLRSYMKRRNNEAFYELVRWKQLLHCIYQLC